MSKILIVVDMQNDFVDGALGTPEAQVIVPKVVEKVKTYNSFNTIFTKDTHYREDYLNTLEGKMLPVPHCIIDTKGWGIIPQLKPYVDRYICKHTFSYENWRNYDWYVDGMEIELVGVCTDICVISNALALRMFFPNAKITVDASCCAGTTPDNHKAALQVMKSCQIEIINEGEVNE